MYKLPTLNTTNSKITIDVKSDISEDITIMINHNIGNEQKSESKVSDWSSRTNSLVLAVWYFINACTSHIVNTKHITTVLYKLSFFNFVLLQLQLKNCYSLHIFIFIFSVVFVFNFCIIRILFLFILYF